jgi:hypothetical protein
MSPPLGFDPPAAQPVAVRYTSSAIPAHLQDHLDVRILAPDFLSKQVLIIFNIVFTVKISD